MVILFNVYEATKETNMKESNVRADLGLFSQAVAFNYKNGIREYYIGIERDPWTEERK